MRLVRVVLSVVIIAVMLFNLCGCASGNITSNNLMVGITPNKVAVYGELEKDATFVHKFSLELFKNSYKKGENTLISPLSVIYALGMTANGAKGETLKQMEDVLGMKTKDLNVFLYNFMDKLNKKKGAKLKLANSVWFTADERFSVNKDFLQTNADYYGADAFKTPMNKTTANDINSWVDEKTDGEIQKLIKNDDIKGNTVMCLLNALCFEGDWIETYDSSSVFEDEFTSATDQKQNCEYMSGEEWVYLEDKNSKGFVKPYKNSDFAFVALLPNENITLEEYINAFDAKEFNEMMQNKTKTQVATHIPKFEIEYDYKLNETLIKMGIKDMFSSDLSDLSGVGSSTAGNIWVEKIKQKTFISVAEKGTRAGAATTVIMVNKSARGPKCVYLNRPFVYMIIDTNTNIPIFMGTLNSV